MTGQYDTAMAELDAEIAELDAEFGELEADFGSLADDMPEFAELEAELETADLEEFEAVSISSLGDDVDVAFVSGFIKRKAKKLISKIVRLVRRHGARCAKCLPKVLKAVRLLKAGRVFAALRAAYSAYRCIKACIR